MIFRYLILYKYGGFYLDLDFVILNSMSQYWQCLVYEPPDYVTNAAMAFPSKHGFLQMLLNHLGCNSVNSPRMI